VGTHPKAAILKQLPTHFKAKHEKPLGCNTTSADGEV